MDTTIAQVNDELLRLGYSTYSGDAHGYEAYPDANPALAILGHPDHPYAIAAYDAATLLTVLRQLPAGTGWETMQDTLRTAMVGEE